MSTPEVSNGSDGEWVDYLQRHRERLGHPSGSGDEVGESALSINQGVGLVPQPTVEFADEYELGAGAMAQIVSR